MVLVERNAAGEVTDLLRQLIRNACVNDGTPGSGQERRNADVLMSVLDGCGVDIELYEPQPGRVSLVARMQGSRPGAASLTLLGHTDVVPADPAGWRHDPFGGELVDDEVWGRGAIDMLNLTASMAVGIRRLALSGFRPAGDLVFIAVADEEALGTHGAGWLTTYAAAEVATDFLVTEAGGFPIATPAGIRLPVVTAEKGSWWCTLVVKGAPGHASQPLRTDNALVKAAEAVRRLAEHDIPAEIHESWRRFVRGLALPGELTDAMLDPERVGPLCDDLPAVGLARQIHASTHTTVAPTVAHGGTKVNVIPDRVEIQVDIRVLPGWGAREVEAMMSAALGDLAGEVDITWGSTDSASSSPSDTPMWDAMQRVAGRHYPEARCIPFLTAGATDARFFRRLGTVAYGFGLFSNRLSFEDYGAMFHGVDERVDVESLRLSTELWEGLAREMLG
jgi:acetylornithine deacetylase/succinyl-diaminopimelate desuccinylase-like protein